ncbi:30S ribosomal protein S2 [Candidatus Peregrinibacteria bacterium CG10_big_fil_rev_8_21_14_0_10_55_24]|nr:MAG: 30S ribosomal protein S2 [Candidatus Peregrinibacteria bacterium CG10_big_fil_rev_8_21_14_0_10_55_24]
MPIPTEKELLDACCHIGHRKDKWNPRMARYLFGARRNIHIFDLVQTRQHLEDVCSALKKLQNEGKTILLVSTKPQSIPLIEALGKALNQPIVTKKWIPGLLTNWHTMKRRIKHYLDLQKSFQTGDVEKYKKKEQMQLRKKLAKLDAALSGVAGMRDLPDAVFVVDAMRNHVTVLEAKKLKIPVYGICDSIANPDEFTAFIPANDDAVSSLSIILETITSQLKGSQKSEPVLSEA